MSLPEFGVKKPVTNLMIFFAIIIIALYSMSRLGIDMMPEIEPPQISVIATYPGAGSLDVETNVTEELENQLGTTPGLEKITSTSSEGSSIVRLKFIWGTNLDEASNDVRDRIELAKRFLPDIPDEMENPFIFKFNTANIPIIYFAITAQQTYPDLYDLVDKRIGDAIRQMPGVGTVQIQGGGLERQINIFIDRQRLEGYGFSILDIENKLRQENITQPVGSLKTGLTDYLIRLPGEFARPEEINLIILGKRNGKPVYLRDVAKIEDGFKEITSLVRFKKNPGIMMMVQKQSGTNSVEVAGKVKKTIEEIAKTLPPDVKINTIFDTSQDIVNSLDSLKFSVWLGIVLVVMVTWFFFRSFAPSLIIALTIPFSLMISFIYLFLSKGTINTISLSSLAIVSGMVVDNAIVIVDNIHRRLERGNRPTESAIFGTSEMFLSVAASTLTTVVVFVPMLFIPGVVGIIFGGLAMIIIVTLGASLYTATTFAPMLSSKWLRLNGRKKSRIFERFYAASERWFKSWEGSYAKALGYSLSHKKLILIGFIIVFIASLFLIPFVGSEFLPEEDSGDLRITAHLSIGTRIEESDKVARRIEDILEKNVPEAKYYYARVGQVTGVGRLMGGSSGTHIITAGGKLIPKDQRKRSVKEVGQVVRGKIRQIPGILRTDISTGNPLSSLITGGGGKSVEIEIIGHSFEDTNTLASKIKEIMEKIPGAVDVSISREANSPELKIDVDREKAASLGLDMTTIASSLKSFIQGSTATKYREKGEMYDVYVRLEESSRAKLEDIENLSIVAPLPQDNTPFVGLENLASKQGVSRSQIKLSNIAKIEETTGPDRIERKNRERMVRVQCNTFKRSSGQIVADLKKEVSKLVLPAGIMINIGGDYEEQAKAFADMALLLALGIILVYMVMAAQFESLLDPFIIMFAIPFTFIGVVLGFVLTGTTLSINTFLGVVMLMGIVVNNAIVLISYIIMLRARGLSMYEAVTRAGHDRLRPILMTTITTVAGLLPLALSRGEGSEVWQPLGITMIGGLTFSTLVTLLFVPTLYAVFHRKQVLPGDIKQ